MYLSNSPRKFHGCKETNPEGSLEESDSEQEEEESDNGVELVCNYIDSSWKKTLLPSSFPSMKHCDPCNMDSLLLADQSLARSGKHECNWH